MIYKRFVLSFMFCVFLIVYSCKGSDLPDTSKDIPPPSSMEIKDPKILLKNAEFYLNENRFEAALGSLKAALKYKAPESKVTFLKGRIFLKQKKYDKALSEFETAEKNGYAKDEINLYKGTVYFNKNELKKAMDYYRKSEKRMISAPGGIKRIGTVLYQNMGLLYQKKKQYRKAIDYYNKAIKLNPSAHETFFHAGLTYYKLDNYKKSINYLEKTIKLKPRMFDAYKYLATAYYTKGEKDKSFYIMAKGFIIKQTYQNTQYAHRELSKIKNITRYKEALELMIYSKISIGLYKAAEKLIKKGMRLYPKDSIYPVFLGRLELKKNNAKKALSYANMAEKKFGANFEIEILKGNTYLQLNKDKKAVEHFETALTINPENYTYRYKLADIYRGLKDTNAEYLHQGIYFVLRNQLEQAKYALGKFPDNSNRAFEKYCWLGRVYMEQGVYETALEYLNKSIKLKPDYFLPYTFKTFTLFRLGKKPQGLATLRYYMNKYADKKGIKEIRKLYNSFSRF